MCVTRTRIQSKGDYLRPYNFESYTLSIIALGNSVLLPGDSIRIDLSHTSVSYLCASYSESFTHFPKLLSVSFIYAINRNQSLLIIMKCFHDLILLFLFRCSQLKCVFEMWQLNNRSQISLFTFK